MAARAGAPASSRGWRGTGSAISHDLVKRFGQESFASTAARQFVGVAVAACLEAEGYAAAPKRVRLKGDPIFETGAVFLKRVLPHPSSAQDLLARFVASLDRPPKRKRSLTSSTAGARGRASATHLRGRVMAEILEGHATCAAHRTDRAHPRAPQPGIRCPPVGRFTVAN